MTTRLFTIGAFFLALLALSCAKPREKCDKLARRLMPDPDPGFVETCVACYDQPGYAKMVDCILAVPGGVTEKDIEACGGRERLPLYFHF